MGTRGQAEIVVSGAWNNPPIFLYQHFDSYHLMSVVCGAIRRSRPVWNDAEYMARVIFDDMKDGNSTSLTGYGISNKRHGDIDYLIVVHIPEQKVYEYLAGPGGVPGECLRFFRFDEVPEVVKDQEYNLSDE